MATNLRYASSDSLKMARGSYFNGRKAPESPDKITESEKCQDSVNKTPRHADRLPAATSPFATSADCVPLADRGQA